MAEKEDISDVVTDPGDDDNLFLKPSATFQMDLEVGEEVKAEDLDFLEKYCLSVDRMALTGKAFDDDALDYWYWSLVNAQVRNDKKELDKWLENVSNTDFWVTDGIQSLMDRKSVMDLSPETLESVLDRMKEMQAVAGDVNLEHTVDSSVATPKDVQTFPTHYQVSTQTLLARKFAKIQTGQGSIQDTYEPAAGMWLADKIKANELSSEQMGDILELMENEPPQIPYLLSILQADFKNGTLFGDRQIHSKLTLETMQLVGSKLPEMYKQEAFLLMICRKYRGVNDINMSDDLDTKGEYLQTLADFCKKQGSAHVSLMGLVMYNLLTFKEERGEGYDKDMLISYLSLRRQENKYKPADKKQKELQGDHTQLLQLDFEVEQIPELTAINDDEAFVRRALSYFFLNKAKVEDFSKVLAPSYSKPLRSEVMLMAGKGDEKQVAEMISILKKSKGPSAYRDLKNRVILEFAPAKKRQYSVDDEVCLEIISKNNTNIEVNVYKVNAKNYYKRKKEEIPNDINLSGSAPLQSYPITSEELPIRKESFKQEIPVLASDIGIFVIDVIGNGCSIRALIRKGELRYIVDQDDKENRGHVFQVFNEKNELITDPVIWMEGMEYHGDENGDVTLPFCEGKTRQQLIILEDFSRSGSATLQHFQRHAPNYSLSCGMYIDREQLRSKAEASVIIRATLFLNSEVISLERLTDVQLKLDLEDNTNSKRTRIATLNFSDERETIYTFDVPKELRYIECLLTCKCDGVELISKQLIRVNDVNDTMAIGDMYLFPSGAAGYVLGMFGKNGEAMPNEQIHLKMKHRYLKDDVENTVQTDENGLVYLGKLWDIKQLDCESVSDNVYTEQSFDLLRDYVNLPTLINRKLGDKIKIPFIADDRRKSPLMYLYDKDFIQDFSAEVKYENYYIEISNIPAGTYLLSVRDMQNADIHIHVSGGLAVEHELGEYVISRNRVLELSEDEPLNVTNVTGSRQDGYVVEMAGVNELTRVHLVACAHVPCFNIFGFLSSPNIPKQVIEFVAPLSQFQASQKLDKEYDYIMNRKMAKTYPGNMLVRPTLANGIWSDQNPRVRTADILPFKHIPQANQKLTQKGKRSLENYGLGAKRKEGDTSSLEWLGACSQTMFNISPEEIDGKYCIKIPSDFYLAEHNVVQVLVVDDDNTALRNVILEETEEEVQRCDVRLNPGLDSTKHFAETRRVLCMQTGAEFDIKDFQTAEYEPYEDLEEPYNLFRALADNSFREDFVNFEPLIKWESLQEAEKMEFYDQYSCHEVNLFLYKHDKDFFVNVVKPLIENKTQNCFMDDYLLGNDLQKYTVLHRYQRLNTLEKILLASILQDDNLSTTTLSWVKDKANLEDISPVDMDRIFNLGINSKQLGVAELEQRMANFVRSVTQSRLHDGESFVDTILAKDAIRSSGMFGKEEYISMTRRYKETTYYKQDSVSQTPELIQPSRFWVAFAEFAISKHTDVFLSEWFQIASRNLNEMLLALALLDLPLGGEEPERAALEGGAVRLTAKTPVIVYLRELIETTQSTSACSVSTNYFDPDERTHMVDGHLQDKFITSFTSKHVFGCRVVVTNVSSVNQNVEILCQIPTGAVPCGIQCLETTSYFQEIKPFGTYRREFYFYWPEAGTYSHFPPHINKNGKTIGCGGGLENIEVTETVVDPDTTSWRYISNLALEEQVLDFLANSPEVLDVNLAKICWRCKDTGFFAKVTEILRNRKIFDSRIWAYSLISDTTGQALGEYIESSPELRETLGPVLLSKFVNIDLNAVRDWEMVEFFPLLNPRAHTPHFDYSAFTGTYYEFLRHVAFKSVNVDDVSVVDKLTFVIYLLIRNKFKEAIALFERIKPDEGKEIPLVYDYMDIYLLMCQNKVDAAAKIASKHVNKGSLPQNVLDRFQTVLDFAAEQKDPSMSNTLFDEEEAKRQAEAKKQFLAFEPIEDKPLTLLIEYRNITRCTVNFYITDLEVLFSSHPFQDSNISYKLAVANESIVLDLDPNEEEMQLKLPDELKENNTIIEIVTDELEAVDMYNDTQLLVDIADDEGELRVLTNWDNKPIEGAYCKVYAKSSRTGQDVFYKDGYTDCRGRFDYRTLSTDQMRETSRLAILIASEKNGSVVKEVDIPMSFRSQSFLPGLD